MTDKLTPEQEAEVEMLVALANAMLEADQEAKEGQQDNDSHG